MIINENIRNKRKMFENLKGCTYNIIHMSAANNSRLQKLVPSERWVIVLYHNIAWYTNLIYIFVNINENI